MTPIRRSRVQAATAIQITKQQCRESGSAEKRTDEFAKGGRVSQPARIARQNSAGIGPRLCKYSWHRRYDRRSVFPCRSSLLDHKLICWGIGFVERGFWNISAWHHHECDGEEEVSGRKSCCPRITKQPRLCTCVS